MLIDTNKIDFQAVADALDADGCHMSESDVGDVVGKIHELYATTSDLPAIILAARCALADLEGIMPELEPSGDRLHPGWQTIEDLRSALSEEA